MLCAWPDDSGLASTISLLKLHAGRRLPLREIATMLGTGEPTARERIGELAKLDYRIDLKRGRGYKLVGSTSLPLPWEIAKGLGTRTLGRRLYFFDSIGSTQEYAKRLAAGGEVGSVVIARRQTSGRGRLGRRWVSPDGGIWMSVVLRPDIEAALAALLPMAASLALSRAMRSALKARTELKWPNDVMIWGRKVAGIILDTEMLSDRLQSAVLGVGVNLNIDADALEAALGRTERRHAVAVVSAAAPDAGRRLVRRFLMELERVDDALRGGRAASVVRAWTRRSSTIGRWVSVDGMEGRAVRLETDGALILKCKSGMRRVSTGEISQ